MKTYQKVLTVLAFVFVVPMAVGIWITIAGEIFHFGIGQQIPQQPIAPEDLPENNPISRSETFYTPQQTPLIAKCYDPSIKAEVPCGD